MPNYLLSQSDSRVVIRNFEGFISTYAQPSTYEPHDPTTCAYCRARAQDGQEGVAGLLSGPQMTIEPENWRLTHQRSTAPLVFPPSALPAPNIQVASEVER